MNSQIVIRISSLYSRKSPAKVSNMNDYVGHALHLAGEGNDIILTGQGPIWLYLTIAHALHGVARKLVYRSPVAGDLTIFDHSTE